MKAVIVREHGGLEALRQEELPDPHPGPGTVCIAVKACGINHLDVWVRRGVAGHSFPLPLIPGNDIAGVVRSMGAGVTDLAVGDEVVVAPGVSCGVCLACLSGRDHHCRAYGILGEHLHGGCAEYAVVPRANVMPKPGALSFEQAAAVGIAFLTAWHMLLDRAQLGPGETVLIQAAGSGIGSAAIQIAKMYRARVIATASTDDKLARALELGADDVINYTTENVAREVRRMTGNMGAQVVVEHVGASSWEGSMRSLAWQGRLVTCGASAGHDVSLNLRHVFFKSLSVLGSTMGSKGEFAQVLQHVAAGRLTPVVDRVFPLNEIAEVHRLLEMRQVFGKLIVQP